MVYNFLHAPGLHVLRAGISLAATEISLGDAIARPYTYERDPRGTLGLLADRDRRVLVGAWAVAPLASEWIHQAALAIRAAIPVHVLLDQVAQFPTYTEALCLPKISSAQLRRRADTRLGSRPDVDAVGCPGRRSRPDQ